MDLEAEIVRATELYQSTQEKIKRVSQPYENHQKSLTDEVERRFGEILRELGPLKDGVTIEEFRASYNPLPGSFQIKIVRIDTPNGKLGEGEGAIAGDYGEGTCPHIYLEPITGFGDRVDSRVEEFKRSNHVSYIENPLNYCDHK